MKIRVGKKFVGLMLLAVTLISIATPASGALRHWATRYVWGVVGTTETPGRHYTRAWMSGLGTDSGRVYGSNLTRATAYGSGTAHTRYGW